MAITRPRALPTTRQPILDFLAPSWTRTPIRRAHLSTSSHHSTSSQPDASLSNSPSTSSSSSSAASRPCPPLTPQQRAYLSSALRVNQAGELAATLIYTAQTPLISRSHPHLRPLMSHMYEQEAGHFSTFNALLAKHRIRPTALTPVWTVAATALGWGTAMLGREAAMACTEAVETEIGEHYNGQVRELLRWKEERVKGGEGLGEELEELLGDVRRIRDEELEHLDHAVGEGAKEAEAYPLLTNVIRSGCKGAIWLSERV